MLANEAAEESEDEDGTGIDMNKTITEEITKGSLEEKKDFLVNFLKRKLIELGTKQATARTLGEDKSPERRPKKSVRFKRGYRVFRLLELDDKDLSSDSEDVEDFEMIFTMNEDVRKKETGKSKKKNKFPLKKCPIRCPRKEHSNGSLYFCNTYRKKDMEEKRAIMKKLHLCITCLSKPEKDHQCPVGRCSRCNGQHNIVLCNKTAEENVMPAQEQNDSSGDDSEEEEYDDYANNRDNVNVARGKTEDKKEKKPSKEGKKGKGESDDCVSPSTETEEKNEKVCKLKRLLKSLSLEYEEGKKEHLASAKADPFSLMTTVESVCYMREHINQNERDEDESSDDGSTTNSESIVVDGSEESEDEDEKA